ncbi:Catenin alpha-2, partial [Ophiophagus hannah]
MLDSAEDVSVMLSAFRPFSEALLLLTNLTEGLLWDLKESLQRKHLAETLQILKNSIPMLFTAKVSHLQYPHEQQMSLSKNYIFDLAKSSIKKLISLLKSNIRRTKKLHERYGLFPQHLHQFLGLMSSPQPIHLHEDKSNLPVEVLIFYCMLFADSSRATLKQKLIQLCHHLLKFRKVIVMDVSTFNGFPKENIKEECLAMKTELEHLNQVIRSAVIYHVLDNLVDIKGPMRRLIEAAMEPYVGKEGLLRKLKPLVTTFFSHSTQMLKAANLILVTCTEKETIEDIEQCIEQFHRLLATVPGLLSELSLFPGNGDVSKKFNFLSQLWSSTTESLMMCLDKILDLHEFLDASVQEMMRHKEASEKALDMQHFEHFGGHTSRLCRQATQIVEFVRRFVAKARDPIFRNGLLVLIKQLKNAITQTEISINWCMARTTSLQAKEEYSKRTKELIEFACNVQKGLDECNQPDILNPLRDGVHDFNISVDFPNALASQDPMEFKFPRINIIYQKDAVRRANLHPLISELTTATRIHDAIHLNGICADLLELANCCIDAAKEALRIVESPMSDKLLNYKEIVVLIPHFIGLAREVEANPVLNSEQLLQTAMLLSEKIDETKHSLTFVVSSWYRLAKQLIGSMPPCSSHDEIQSLDEIMEILERLVQLISKVVHSDDRKLLPVCSSLQEIFLRVQTQFTCVQTRTKYLLEKAQDISKSHPDFAKQDSFDASCILWSVTIQALLNIVDQFIGRDVLALKDLQTKMKHRLCLQSTLTTVSENSVRIQEAAKLSILLCARQGIENEIPSQTEQIKIWTESLLQVANALAVSPIAAPSLLVQFEVLQRKLAITAKAILLQLNGLNGEYLSSIQSVVRLSQFISHGTGSNSDLIQKETFGRKAAFLKANIQTVDKVIRDALEEPSKFLKPKENVLTTTGSLLLLTDEIMGLAGQFHSQLDQHHHLVDSLLYEWSAKAGYLVRQLQSMKGMSETVLQVVRRCLQNDEEHIYSIQPSLLKKEDCTQHQNTPSQGHKAIKAGEGFFSACNKITMTKEEVIATAIQVIAGGEALVKFAGRITKDCLDERCAAELLCALEKTKTINYQLRIITR